MAYTKHTWTTGEVITAGRLNNMEDGIADAGNGGEVLVVGLQEDDVTLNKTWQEIFNAFMSGGCVMHKTATVPTGTINNYYPVQSLASVPSADGGSPMYTVEIYSSTYTCDSPNGYPSSAGGGGDIG